jgi:DNA-binding NtrC family response regulator
MPLPNVPSVLVVDSDAATASTARDAFVDSDVRFVAVPDAEAASGELMHRTFDAVVCDLPGEGFNGFEWLKSLLRTHPLLPVIGVARGAGSRSAIEAVKAGAFDFLTKPLDPAEVRRAVREAIECSRKGSETVAIDPRNELAEESDTLVGNSRAMLDVYKALGRLSPTPVTVLIRGETGTGKELVARALYQHGHRAHRPFVTVNCAAIPENLLESELFGHERGAFTGATATRIGKFEQANNATLFLDEIGDLNHALQAKLLRVLQEKRFQRVGGNEEISVDVRIIAATHRPLERMIAEGQFREDLFYRLNVATIKLPPLRDRTGDIPLLAHFFLKRLSRELGLPPVTMARGALSCLESARLPGNVRQLQNLVRKALLRSRGYPIDRPLVEELLRETDGGGEFSASADPLREWCGRLLDEAAASGKGEAHRLAVEALEGTLLDEALRRSGGNISRTAEWLGLSRLTVREKMKRQGL